MTQEITPQPGIMEIALYQGGASQIQGRDDALKLSSNENPYGPGPAARKAFAASASQLHRYPSTDHGALRRAIGELHRLDPDRIICGAGSDEIIALLCYAYAGPETQVLYTEHGFSMYRISALAAGATPVAAPERDRVIDVDALLAAANDDTRLVFIANPGNPSSTMIGGNEVARLADGLPPKALLVLDGAYAEYVEGFDGGAGFVDQRQNVVMTRTFSKIYGLGGLRIGWGYGPRHVIDVLNRIRGPFNLSGTQLATAEAAVRDHAYTEKCRAENARLRVWLAEALAELGIPSDTSCTNFILARFASQAEAEACEAQLRADGILVRKVGGYGLPQCLRITIGDETACKRVAASVASYKGAAA